MNRSKLTASPSTKPYDFSVYIMLAGRAGDADEVNRLKGEATIAKIARLLEAQPLKTEQRRRLSRLVRDGGWS